MMKRDKSVIASMLGAASTLAGEAVSLLLVRLGVGLHDIYSFDSIIVTVNRYSIGYGLLVNIIAGGVTAVLLYYALEKIGSECILYKAVALSTLAWFFVEFLSTAYFEGKLIDIRPLGDYAVHFIGAFANGIMLGLLFKWVLYRRPQKKAN